MWYWWLIQTVAGVRIVLPIASTVISNDDGDTIATDVDGRDYAIGCAYVSGDPRCLAHWLAGGALQSCAAWWQQKGTTGLVIGTA